MRICRGPECRRPVVYQTRGVCASHNAMLVRTGELKPLRRTKTAVDDDELIEAAINRSRNKGGRPGVEDKGKCQSGVCDRDAEIMTPMPLCKAHYNQQWSGKDFIPLRPYSGRQDPDAEVRQCSVCHRVKTVAEGFHIRTTGKPQSECKFCSGKRNRITRLYRDGRVQEAEALTEVWEDYVGENRNGWTYEYQPNTKRGI